MDYQGKNTGSNPEKSTSAIRAFLGNIKTLDFQVEAEAKRDSFPFAAKGG